MIRNIAIIIGTRPEAIKMAPLVLELQKQSCFKTKIYSTGQHDLKKILDLFKIKIDKTIIKKRKENILNFLSQCVDGLSNDSYLKNHKPDLIIVHGDTTSALAGSLYGFYTGIRVCHIEAGLRSFNKWAPYPEEINRVLIDSISDLHFAPLDCNKENLIKEGVKEKNIFVVGNTICEVFKYTLQENFKHEILNWAKDKKLIVCTLHRRELWGDKYEKVLKAINEIIKKNNQYKMLFLINENKNLQTLVRKNLKNTKNIKIKNSIDVITFHNILARSNLVITDSGGLQEECVCLGVPVLIVRDETERQEIINGNHGCLISTNPCEMKQKTDEVLNGTKKFNKQKYLYGKNNVSKKITNEVKNVRF
jgi:UDP-N-acetylglucosamine 2-epimerase (non-hydrolysing)